MPLANMPRDGHESSRTGAFWPLMLGPGVILGLAVVGMAQPVPAVLGAVAAGGAGYWLSRRPIARAALPMRGWV
jgi:two-component system phosphate regulon sensor histidine kinase PhoR